jgi:hypothetical protein
MPEQASVSADAASPVRRRRVFYIPGYDPFPPRRYRELYRREGQVQARLSGYRLQVLPRAGAGYGWHVATQIDAQRTEAEVEVLVWADLVRASMTRGVIGTYVLLVRTFWIYLSTGAMGRLFRLRRGPVITAMYPVAVLVGQLLLAGAAGGAIWRLGGVFLPPGWSWTGIAGGGVAGWALLVWFRRIDRRLYAQYLLHDYGFTAQHRGRTPPALDARLDAFAAGIGRALASDVDEVLVVGHSSGAHLGVEALARVLRSGAARAGGPALAFLTLGQAIPMQSFLPGANRLRADLHLLAGSDRLTWVDVSAPGDGCCYALCDPVAVSGAAPEGKRWPLVISAAFSQSLRPETWRRLRWRFFRLHFQYLCAFDGPSHYDYFRITAGPERLAVRYASRAPSASRKETVLSPHTGRTVA